MTNDVIYMTDLKGQITHISPQISRYGYNPGDVISHNFTEFLAEDDIQNVRAGLEQTIATGKPTVIRLRIRDSAGNFHWMEDNGAPFTTPSGSVGGITGILRDVTERREAEEALFRSEKKYRNIIENIQDVVYRTDRNGKLTMFSPYGVKLAGYDSEEEMIGLDIANDTYQNPREREVLLAALAEKGFVENYPLVLKTREGKSRFVTTSSHFYYDEQGDVLGVEGILHDVTEQKHAEDTLAMVNRKLNLLSSITRHDIRNQINGLKAYLILSREYLHDPAVIEEFIAKEEVAADAIEHQILFTKEYEDLGNQAPVWQNIDAIVGRTVSILPMRDVRVLTDVRGLEVSADPLFDRIFYNLIDNALRYGGEKMTRIRASSHDSGTGRVIILEDDGRGISAEDKERLFTRGFGKQTGLGLFLSREILSITGITIAENGEPGKGARFEITVPEGAYRFTKKMT